VIWDADFLHGLNDDYVLCEINASSTFSFPEFAMLRWRMPRAQESRW
jgi:hypothetical protein